MKTLSPEHSTYQEIHCHHVEHSSGKKYPTRGLAFYEHNELMATIFEDKNSYEGLQIEHIEEIAYLLGVPKHESILLIPEQHIEKYAEKNIGTVSHDTVLHKDYREPISIRVAGHETVLPVLSPESIVYQEFYYMHPVHLRQQGIVVFQDNSIAAVLVDDAYSRYGLNIADLKAVFDLFGITYNAEPLHPSHDEFEAYKKLSGDIKEYVILHRLFEGE